jgi:hypothetical protein
MIFSIGAVAASVSQQRAALQLRMIFNTNCSCYWLVLSSLKAAPVAAC